MDEDTCMVDLARYFMEFIQEESCGKCTPCREGTRIMLNILTRICQGKGTMEDLDNLEQLAYEIKDTALCGLGQTAPNPILSTLKYFRDEYIEHIRDKKCRAGVCADLVYAPCSNSCPASVDVPAYLAYTKIGQYERALTAHMKTNPFPAVCGRVCPAFCETRCRRRDIDSAINIRAVKRFMADEVNKYQPTYPDKKESNGKKVAVIGAGPSGLSCAYFLTMIGYKVTVFEALPEPGGMLRYAIPEYRLPKTIVQKEINALVNYGIEIKTNKRIGTDITVEQLRKQGYNAFYLGAGAWDCVIPPIDGLENKKVMSGLDFLYKVNNGEKIEVGDEVVVIGGGNTAIDAARTAKRLGANVSIIYRRTRSEMPADIEEIEQAEIEGINIFVLQNIKSVSEKDGKLQVEMVKMRLGEFDSSGRRKPIEIQSSSFSKEVDTLILALGQKTKIKEIADAESIALNRNATVKSDSDNGQTSVEDIFAGGDVVSGPATVVEAIGAAQRAAEEIDSYLTGIKEKTFYPWRVKDPIDVPFDPEAEPVGWNREEHHLVSVDERKGNQEVELTWDSSVARKESERCLRCEFKEE
jgi:NADH-quinone oxidoreductase subunit F